MATRRDALLRRTLHLALALTAAAAVVAGVARAAPPANDRFASAQPIAGAAGSVVGTNVEATAEAGEPGDGAEASRRSVWYRWTAPTTDRVIFDTCTGTTFDTVLAAYVGTDVASLTRVASDDDSCSVQSRILFQAVAGTTYSIVVDSFGSSTGEFTLSWRVVRAPPNDAFAAAQEVAGASGTTVGTNVGALREEGEPAPDNAPTVWYRWAAPFTGGVTFETCRSTFDTILAAYTGSSVSSLVRLASDDDGCGVASRIRFAVRAGRVYHLQVRGSGGATGDIRLAWRAVVTRHDDFASARRILGSRGVVSGSNVGATAERGETRGDTSVWYRWRAARSAPMTFDTCSRATSFDTVVTVYRGTARRGATRIARDDDRCGDRSRVVFLTTRGVEYRIAVGGFEGEMGEFRLVWRPTRASDAACVVPDVRSRTLAQARVAIEAGLCRLGRVVYVQSSIVPSGHVVDQFPRAEIRLPVFGRVNVEVSRG